MHVDLDVVHTKTTILVEANTASSSRRKDVSHTVFKIIIVRKVKSIRISPHTRGISLLCEIFSQASSLNEQISLIWPTTIRAYSF